MNKRSHDKTIEKLKERKSSKVIPNEKRASFSNNDFIENPQNNYPNTFSKEYSTNVSLNENTYNEFSLESISITI